MMGDDVGNLGNFKGVMLCNRPAQIPGSLQAVVGASTSQGPSRPAFISSVVPDSPAGLAPIKKSRPSIRREPKFKDADVTWRHKRWLQEFQERRVQLNRHLEVQLERRKDNQQRFADRSQQMRDAIRQVQKEDPTDRSALTKALAMVPGNEQMLKEQSSSAYQNHYEPESKQAEPAYANTYNNNNPNPISSTSSRRRPKKPQNHKPGWARTEQEDDDVMDGEAENLIDFVSGLDYDSYIDDLEVREALKFVHDRVKSMEEKKAEEEAEKARREAAIARGEDPDAEYEEIEEDDPNGEKDDNGNLKRHTIRRMKTRTYQNNIQQPEWNSSTKVMDDTREVTAKLSNAVLDSSRPIRNVHSSASVRALMEKEKGGKGYSMLPPIADAEPNENFVYQPPLIVTHDNPAKSQRTVDPNNLPYLYRHPAI